MQMKFSLEEKMDKPLAYIDQTLWSQNLPFYPRKIKNFLDMIKMIDKLHLFENIEKYFQSYTSPLCLDMIYFCCKLTNVLWSRYENRLLDLFRTEMEKIFVDSQWNPIVEDFCQDFMEGLPDIYPLLNFRTTETPILLADFIKGIWLHHLENLDQFDDYFLERTSPFYQKIANQYISATQEYINVYMDDLRLIIKYSLENQTDLWNLSQKIKSADCYSNIIYQKFPDYSLFYEWYLNDLHEKNENKKNRVDSQL